MAEGITSETSVDELLGSLWEDSEEIPGGAAELAAGLVAREVSDNAALLVGWLDRAAESVDLAAWVVAAASECLLEGAFGRTLVLGADGMEDVEDPPRSSKKLSTFT